jgi:hypothetical protein
MRMKETKNEGRMNNRRKGEDEKVRESNLQPTVICPLGVSGSSH